MVYYICATVLYGFTYERFTFVKNVSFACHTFRKDEL